MSNLFTINNGVITDDNVFGKDLTQSTTTSSKKGVKLKKTSTITPFFSAAPVPVYGVALNLSSRNITPIGTLTIEISSKNNGLISTSTYPVSCFTGFKATNNYITIHPQNWQLLQLPLNTTLPFEDLYTLLLSTSEEDQLSLVGDPACFNAVNGDKIQTVAEFPENFSPVRGKNIASVDLSTPTGGSLAAPSNANYGLDSGDFTIEGFFYFKSFRQEWNPLVNIGNGWGTGSSAAWGITYNSSQQRIYLWRNTKIKDVAFSGVCNIPMGRWIHLAVCRHGTDVSVWINGICTGGMQYVTTDFANISGLRLYINNLIKDFSQIYSNMFVSNIRITKNIALFNSSFQKPQENLSIRSNTLMLYSYPYTDQYLVCNSALTITSKYFLEFADIYNKITFDKFISIGATGPVLSVDNPFNIEGNRSLRLNGDVMFKSLESYGTFSSSDFTVELWLKMSDTAGTQTVIDYTGRQFPVANNLTQFNNFPIFSLCVIDGFLRAFLSSNTTARAFTNGATDIPLSANQWYHIALVRVENTVKIYVNGIRQLSDITLTERLFGADGAILHIGSTPPASINWFDINGTDRMRGYINNVRIIQGAGLYKEDFNINSPLAGANIPSPEPLDSYYEEGISGQRDLILGFSPTDVATLSSTYSIVNKASSVYTNIYNPAGFALSFDTSKQQYIKTLYSPDSVYRVGSGDYTIEAWVYLNSLPLNNNVTGGSFCIFSAHNNFAYFIGSSKIYGLISSTTVGNINHSITANTWTHIAIMRSNNTIYYYENGVFKGKSVAETIWHPSPAIGTEEINVTIGSYSDGLRGFFNGHILDFRLIRGRALYIEDPILQGVDINIPAPLTVINNISIAKGSLDMQDIPHFSSESPYIDAPSNSENSLNIHCTSDVYGSTAHYFKYDFSPVKGDFTIELWYKPTKRNSDYHEILNATNNVIMFRYNSIGRIRAIIRPPGSLHWWMLESDIMPLDVWYHIAFVRKDGLFKLIVNGVQYDTVFYNTDEVTGLQSQILLPSTQTQAVIVFGELYFYPGVAVSVGDGPSRRQSYGYITDVRITPTLCLYPDNPTPTSSLRTTTDFSVKEGLSKLDIVRSSSIFESTQHPYNSSINYGSLFVNNKTLTRPPLSLTSAFTIEAWLKPTTKDTSFFIISCRVVGRANSWVFGYNSFGGLYFAYTDLNSTQDPILSNQYQRLIAPASILPVDLWSHVAVSRNTNNEWSFYINGVSLPYVDIGSFDKGREFSNTFSTNIAGEFIGFITDVRVSTECLYDIQPLTFQPIAFQPTPVTPDTVFLITSDNAADNTSKILDDDFFDISGNISTDKFVKVYDNLTKTVASTPRIVTELASYTDNSGFYYSGDTYTKRTAILDELLPVGGSSDWTFECFFKGTGDLPSVADAADLCSGRFLDSAIYPPTFSSASNTWTGKWIVERNKSNSGQILLSTPYFGIGLGNKYITLVYNDRPDSTVEPYTTEFIHIEDTDIRSPRIEFINASPPIITTNAPSHLVHKHRYIFFKHNITNTSYKSDWHHIAIQRRNNEFICLLDGVRLFDDRPFCAGNIYLAGSVFLPSTGLTTRLFHENPVDNLPVTLYDNSPGTPLGIGGYICFNILPLKRITHIKINVNIKLQNGFTARARYMNLAKSFGDTDNSKFIGPVVRDNEDIIFKYAKRNTITGDTDPKNIRPDNVTGSDVFDTCTPGKSIGISLKMWQSNSSVRNTGDVVNYITLNSIEYSSDNGSTYQPVPATWLSSKFKRWSDSTTVTSSDSGYIDCNTAAEVITLSEDSSVLEHYLYASSLVDNYTPYKIEGGSWGRYITSIPYSCDNLTSVPREYCNYRNRISFLAANYDTARGVNITNIRINEGAIYDETTPPLLTDLITTGPLPSLPNTKLLLTFPRKAAQISVDGIKDKTNNYTVKNLYYPINLAPVNANTGPNIVIPSVVLNPHPSYVSLMTLQDELIVDNSVYNKPISNIRSVTTVLDQDLGRFVTEFDGNNKLQVSRSLDFIPGSNQDFTLELWFKLARIPPTRADQLIGIHSWFVAGDWALIVGSNSIISLQCWHRGVFIYSKTPARVNEWCHIAICRRSNVLSVYKDGVKEASINYSGPIAGTGAEPLTIGSDSRGLLSFKGVMYGLRMTMGQALYTGDFTPGVNLTDSQNGSTTTTLNSVDKNNLDPERLMHPTTINTVSPIRYPSVVSSTLYKNFYNSSIHVGLDRSKITNSTPRPIGAGLGVMKFSSLSASAPAPITFNGDFEISCWIYLPSHFQKKDTGIFGTPFDSLDIPADVVDNFARFFVNFGSIYFTVPGIIDARYIWDEQIVPLETWTHIALVRINSTIYLLIDGKPTILGRYTDRLVGFTQGIDWGRPLTVTALHVGPISLNLLKTVPSTVTTPIQSASADVNFYIEEFAAINNANRFKPGINQNASIPTTPITSDFSTILIAKYPFTSPQKFEPNDCYYFFGQPEQSIKFPYLIDKYLQTATYEFWVRPDRKYTGTSEVWFSTDIVSSGDTNPWLSVGAHGSTTDKANKVWFNHYITGLKYSEDECVAYENWMHIAVVKTSIDWAVYVDGVEKIRVPLVESYRAAYPIVGKQGLSNNLGVPFYGALGYFQLSKTAKYTESFPVPNSAPVIDTDTIALYKPAYTEQFGFPSQSFLYGPPYAKETASNTIDLSPWGPGIDGSYRTMFGVTSRYRIRALCNTTSLNYVNSFTIEGWYNINSFFNPSFALFETAAAYVRVMLQNRTNDEGASVPMWVFALYNPTLNKYGSTTPSIPVNLNTWYFVQVIYNEEDTSLSLYINSVLYSVIDIPTSIIGGERNINSTITICGSQFKGYISNFRISKSIKSTDTPAGPFSVDEDTLLLVKAPYNGGYEYYEPKPTVLLQADTSVSSDEEPFADGGSLDAKAYVEVPSNFNPDINFGTKNLTIEWFQKVLAYDRGHFPIINLGGDRDLNSSFGVRFSNNGTQVRVTTGPNRGFTMNVAAPTVGAWQHCALVRSSNKWSMYIDKMLAGTSVTNTDDIPPLVLDGYLGCFFSGSTQILRPGYISNIRINQEALYIGADITDFLNKPLENIPGTLFLYQKPYQDFKYQYNNTASTALLLRAESFPDFIPTPAEDSRDDCMFFDGVRDIKIHDFADPKYDLGFNNSPYTLELWVYLLDTADRVIISRGGGSDVWSSYGNAYSLYTRSGALYWSIAATGINITNLTLKFSDLKEIVNKWSHVAITYDQNATRMYVNGFLSQEVVHESLPNYAGGDGLFQVATCDTEFNPYYYIDSVGNYPIELRVGNSKNDSLTPCYKSALLLFFKPDISRCQIRFTFSERVTTSPADVYINTYINGIYHSTQGRVADGKVMSASDPSIDNQYIYVTLNTTNLTKIVLALIGNSNLIKINTTAEVFVTQIQYRYNNTGAWLDITENQIQSSNSILTFEGVRSSIESRPVTYTFNYNSGLFFLGHNQGLPRNTTQTNFFGYISNFRINMGICLYDKSTYIIPTVPLSSTAETTLLMTSPYNQHEFNRFVTAPFSNSDIDSIAFLDYKKYLLTADALPQMNGDFCIESWIYSIRDNVFPEYIFDGRGSSVAAPFLIGVNEIPGYVRVYEGDGDFLDAGKIYPRTWHHIAVIKKDSILMIYIDGKLCNTKISGTSWGGSQLLIGKRHPGKFNTAKTGPDNFMGFLSNIRIVNKDTVYLNSCQTPPEDLLTVDNDTVFLLDTGVDVNKSIITTNYQSITASSEPVRLEDSITFTPLTEKSPWGNNYVDFIQFDTNTCISFASNSALNLYQTPFLLEAWIYPTTNSGNRTILYTPSLHIYLKSPNNSITVDGVEVYSTTTSVEPFAWYHIVVASNIANTVVFINGELALKKNIQPEISTASSVLLVGSTLPNGGGASQFYGYMSNIRFTSYPTSSVWLDKSADLKISTNRLAIVDSSPYPGYTGSMYFRRQNQKAITQSNPAFFLGRNNDFTIETWVRFNFKELNSAYKGDSWPWSMSYHGIWSFFWSTPYRVYFRWWGFFRTTIAKFELFVDRSGGLGLGSLFFEQNIFCSTGANTIRDDTWHFVVVQKQGDKMYIIVDGIVKGVSTYPTYTTQNHELLLLTQNTNNTYFDIGATNYRVFDTRLSMAGLIGDVRVLDYAHYPIVSGVVEPPTEPLTVIPGTKFLLTPHDLIVTDNYFRSFFNTSAIPLPIEPYSPYNEGPLAKYVPTKLLLKNPYNRYRNDIYTSYLVSISAAANTRINTDALLFNSSATTDVISLEHNNKYNLFDTSFNLSVWVYPTALPTGANKIILNCEGAYSFYINNQNRVCFDTMKDNIITQYVGVSAISTSSVRTWHNIVYNYNKPLNQFTVYINQRVDSMHLNLDVPNFSKNHSLFIGNNKENTTPFRGLISDIHLEKRPIIHNPNFNIPSRNLSFDNMIMFVYAFPDAYPARKYQGPTSLRTLAIDTTTTPVNYRGEGIFLENGTHLLTETATFYMPNTFTYECFFKPLTTDINGTIFKNSRSNLFISDNIVSFEIINDSGIKARINSLSNAININQWNHIAAVRTAQNYVYLFINGKMHGSVLLSGQITNSQIKIGEGLNGLLSYARVSKLNYYTFIDLPHTTSKPVSGTFTSLILTSPYYDSLKFTAYTPIAINSLSSTDPFNSNNNILAYCYNQSISLPDNDRLDLNNCLWSYEAWIMPVKDVSRNMCLFDKRSTSGIIDVGVMLDVSNNIVYYTNSNTGTVLDTFIPFKQWTHIAVSCDGAQTHIHINGVYKQSFNFIPLINGNGPFNIGAIIDGSSNFCGYMANIRIVRGYAAYTTESFSLPSIPPTYISNTSVLLVAPYIPPFYYASFIQNVHISSTIIPDVIIDPVIVREITLEKDATINNLFIHKDGYLKISNNIDVDLKIIGVYGLQITSEGTLNIN